MRVGEFMKIAIDKNSYSIKRNKDDEYIYLYDNERLEDLLDTKMHCIQYKHCDYVDINLTDYDVDCIKKAKHTDKDWDVIEITNYKIGIIIPNYNYGHTIRHCLNSILTIV